MAIERIDTNDDGAGTDQTVFTAEQMAGVIRERDQYRQALYERTDQALLGSSKVADALEKVDTLHRELHTVSGERDKARRELADADELLDHPLQAARFFAGVYVQLGREVLKSRRQRRSYRMPRKPNRERFGR